MCRKWSQTASLLYARYGVYEGVSQGRCWCHWSLSGVVAPRLQQSYPSRSSRVPHRSAAVRTERCCTVGKFEHVTPLLRDLHWLRVGQRVEFKLAVLVYCCLNGQGPPHLASDLHRVADLDTRRRLRSSSSDALTVPLTRLSTGGDRAFPVAAARVWNSLPASVTSSPSLSTFLVRSTVSRTFETFSVLCSVSSQSSDSTPP